MEHFFDEVWAHRTLLALENQTPINAVGDRKLRKKLRGVVAFLADCGAYASVPYDFDRLRHKLGLDQTGAAKPSGGMEIGAMAASELAALKAAELADEQLEQALQAAKKLDADELAENFASTLVARNVSTRPADRAPLFLFLVQKAIQDGRLDDAL